MTARPDDPFVIPADELAPAPPRPPTPRRRPTTSRRRARRCCGHPPRRPPPRRRACSGPCSAACYSLVVSVAAYDYLTSLLPASRCSASRAGPDRAPRAHRPCPARPRALGLPPPRPHRRPSTPTPPPPTPPPTSTPPSPSPRRLERFYAGRAELRWSLAAPRRAARRRARRRRHHRADRARALRPRSTPRPAARSRSRAAPSPPPPRSSRSPSSTCWRRSRRTSAWSAASPRSTAPTPASSAPGGSCACVATHLLATGARRGRRRHDRLGRRRPASLARVSRRFGEGVVNGALTARVGIAAMDVCRPLPFAALPRPKVSNLIGRALTGLFQKG